MVDNTVIFPSPDEILDAVVESVQSTEDLTEKLNSLEFYIDYTFYAGTRKNRFGKITYGSAVTFDFLYELLIQQNNGISFIDEYLDKYYRYSFAKEEVDKLLKPLSEEILSLVDSTEEAVLNLKQTKSGLLDKRQKGKILNVLSNIDEIKKRIDNITDNIDSIIPKSSQEKIAQTIKEDIKMAIKTGKIGLVNPVLKPETIKRRVKAGLPPFPKFYASGQFVDHIKIIVQLKEKEWRTM